MLITLASQSPKAAKPGRKVSLTHNVSRGKKPQCLEDQDSLVPIAHGSNSTDLLRLGKQGAPTEQLQR